MIAVLDRAPAAGDELAGHLSREGLPAVAVTAATQLPDHATVAIVCVRGPEQLPWVESARREGERWVLVLTSPPLRVDAFERGADDVAELQPLSLRELTLRTRNLFRRTAVSTPPAAPTLDWMRSDDRSVRVAGCWVGLSPVEFSLLQVLVEQSGRVVPRDVLLGRVWGREDTVPRTVDTTVKRLRARLGHAGDAIETVRALGYRFDPARLGA